MMKHLIQCGCASATVIVLIYVLDLLVICYSTLNFFWHLSLHFLNLRSHRSKRETGQPLMQVLNCLEHTSKHIL